MNMDNLWQIITGAPWWVYVLFIVLVKQGVLSFKPRTIKIQRLAFIPVIFFVWSFYRLYQNGGLDFPSLIVGWVLSLSIGAYLGIREVYSWKIQIDKKKGAITIPGNFSTLVLIIVIFVLNFFWGYIYSTFAQIPYWIYLCDTVSTTICTGFFIGRGALFLKRYFQN